MPTVVVEEFHFKLYRYLRVIIFVALYIDNNRSKSTAYINMWQLCNLVLATVRDEYQEGC